MATPLRLLPALLVLLATAAPAADLLQAAPDGGKKRALTPDDYDSWQSIRGQAISRDGRWVAFTVAPKVGDGELIVRSTIDKTIYRHARGSGARFSPDSRYLVFRIAVPWAEKRAYDLEKLRKSKKKESEKGPSKDQALRRGRRFRRGGFSRSSSTDENAPKPCYAILDLYAGKVLILEGVRSFSLPEEGPAVLVYQIEKPKSSKPVEKEKAETAEAKKKEEPAEQKTNKKEKTPKYLTDGHTLVLRNLASGEETRIKGVVSHHLTRKRGYLLFACNSKKDDPKIARGLHAIDLASGKRTQLVAGAASFQSFSSDREEKHIVFLSNRADREAEKPTWDLYAWDFAAPAAEVLVASRGAGQPLGDHRVARSYTPRFCREGEVLLVGVEPPPEKELEPILADDEVKLDLWHWKDPILQPMQAKRASRLRSRTLTCAFDLRSKKLVRISANPHESVSFLTPSGSRLLIGDSRPYARLISWDSSYSDYYVASSADGTRRKVAARVRGGLQPSPNGRYLLSFKAGQWWCHDLRTGSRANLTKGIGVSFAQRLWDSPAPARSYGVAGWTQDDTAVVLYDEFDLWKIAPDGSAATCLSDGAGRAARIALRWMRLDPEQRFLPAEESILLQATNTETMATGFYTERLGSTEKPHRLIMKEMAFGRLSKAREAERVLFTLSTYAEPPNLWTSDLAFERLRKLSSLNPQQRKIRWGHAELVRWSSGDGKALKGILIKPEGFDPTKKYPMMVYFYERLSSRLHRYVTPGPGTSPNAAYYVSNGYLWFMPDIAYDVGYPGESCLKCVVSGVQHLIDQGFVDRKAIGAAGHSWGGYQTAFLITRTDIFAAVESGAPVSNMTSAYGGIRWGTGMSRAFQYEKTQSRIGATLWQAPLRYIDNSPLFRADRVRTPILMMHNDHDGAVPWYQGIEYFCALRRLGKEAYLFDYVGSDHGLRRRADMLDWTMRMQQFFDHHLRGAPMPAWMRHGVPYIEREREKRSFRPLHYPPAKKGKTSAPKVKRRVVVTTA